VCFSLSYGAVTNWGGVNSYFLHSLSASDRAAHLDALKARGIKAVRIFINHVDGGAKGSSASGVPDIEETAVGNYNDAILTRVDTLMLEASQRGIKLIISLHDRYSLGCWQKDGYVSKYNIPNTAPNCNTGVNQPIVFYTNGNAQADFDKRLIHILTHKNPSFGNRPWGEISEAVLAFEPQNEAQGHMNNPDWSWHCKRAAAMAPYVKNGILIATGGGVDFGTSLVDQNFQCEHINVVCLHSYSTSTSEFNSQLSSAKSKANSHGKRVILEEFGVTGSDTSKANTLASLIDATINNGIPFLPWEFLRPTTSDYEFYTDGNTWKNVGCRAQVALTKSGAFTWNELTSAGANATACGGSGGKGDWELCEHSSECNDKCCSKQYSDDGKLKCTPGGTQCV